MIKKLFAALLMTGLMGSASAVPVSLQFEEGTLFNAGAVDLFETTGASMEGMVVELTFSDGSIQSSLWSATGSSSGGVSLFSAAGDLLWSLEVEGDTYLNPFLLTVGSIGDLVVTALRLDGAGAQTAFDVYLNNQEGSPGSSFGEQVDFAPYSSQAGLQVSALYSNQLAVAGAFYDDLFTQLQLSFAGAAGTSNGLGAGSVFSFFSDTDTTIGAITPIDNTPTNTVPEPTALLLVALGLAGVGVMRKSTRGA